ncbi:hypothetical protein [Microvirga tunisiensis]|uniref:Uncharacterized protein n=1 Tax=Microvirga tunisiensis TaxID=2108360 RepID=A0A5N7MVA2_9HYPH|nr:hypothetical protein [Microvirga tunisiensis]MPR12872.1 hypothetical protein [Microvirga tunisiensis]MPR30818.1 hypothetical protein [Microvirga tunisiensis]
MVEHVHGGLLKWIEMHPGTASWAQAIGSVLAIAAAIWIASAQSREARREAKAAKKAQFDAFIGLSDEALRQVKKVADVIADPKMIPQYYVLEHSSKMLEDLASALLSASLSPFGSSGTATQLQRLRGLVTHTGLVIARADTEYREKQAVSFNTGDVSRTNVIAAESAAHAIRAERDKLE